MKYYTGILIFSFVCLISGDLLVRNEEISMFNYLKNVVDMVSEQHHGGYISLILNNGSKFLANAVLEYVHKNMISKIIVINFDKDFDGYLNQSEYLGYLKLFLLITNTTENAIKTTEKLSTSPFCQKRSRTLIVTTDTPRTQNLESMFQYFWTNKFPLVAAMFHEHIFTFNPFLGDFVQDFSGKDVREVFYNKFANINGKRLNVLLLKYDDRDKIILTKKPNGTLEWGGYEMELMRCLVSKMKGTIEIFPASFYLLPGERDPWRQTNNMDFTGSIVTKKRIIDLLKIDIMNTEEIIQPEEVSGVTESLYPHATDDLKIIIKKGSPIPYYKYLFLVYNYKVWVVFVITILVGTVSWIVIGSGLYPSGLNKFINLIRVTTGGSLPRIPKVDSERFFIAIWLMFTLIMSTAFTSNLATVLMQNKYYPNVDTMDELLEGGYNIVGYRTQLKELKKAFNGTSKAPLFNRMIQMPDKYANNNTTLNNLTEMLLLATNPILVGERRAIYVTKHRVFKDVFHIVRESPLPNYTALQLPTGSPFLDYVNLILRRIIESGMFQFWRKQHEHYYVLTKLFFKPDEADETRTQANPLTIYHLQAAFLILFTGLTASSIVFVAENFRFKFSPKKILQY